MELYPDTLQKARDQGLSDDEIKSHLVSDQRFATAFEKGLSLEDIATHFGDKRAAEASAEPSVSLSNGSSGLRSYAATIAKDVLSGYAGLQNITGRLAGAVMTVPAQIREGAKAQTQKEGEAAMRTEDAKLAAVGGVQMGDEATREYAASMYDAYGVDPNAQDIPSQVGRGLGHATAVAPTFALGGAGLGVAATQMASQAYSESYAATEKELRDAGVTDQNTIKDLSEKAGQNAAAEQAPGLAAYFVAGKAGSAIVNRLLPEALPALTRAIATGTGAALTNVGTSALLRKVEGQPLAPTPEGLAQDVAFGALMAKMPEARKGSTNQLPELAGENARRALFEEQKRAAINAAQAQREGALPKKGGALAERIAAQPGPQSLEVIAPETPTVTIAAAQKKKEEMHQAVDTVISDVASAEPPKPPAEGEPNATQTGLQPESNIEQHPRDGESGTSATPSNRGSDEQSGQVAPEAQVATEPAPSSGTPESQPTPTAPSGIATESAGEADPSGQATVQPTQAQLEAKIMQALQNRKNATELGADQATRDRYSAEAKALQDQMDSIYGKPVWTEATSVTNESPKPEKNGPRLGFAAPGTGIMLDALDKVARVTKEATRLPEVTGLRKAIVQWSAKQQKSFGEINAAQKEIIKTVRSPIRRAAITNWIEANGDGSVLRDRELASKDLKLRLGYEAAQNLTPGEIAIAQKVKTAFDALHARGMTYGIFKTDPTTGYNSFIDNYVNHIWEKKPSRLTHSTKTLRDNFRFARARTFKTFFEGEQVGFKPKTKDIAKLVPVYIHEMNSAIAARQFVQELSGLTAKDGRPMLIQTGRVNMIEKPTGDKAYLIKPNIPVGEDTQGYKSIDQPAMHNWTWKGKDEAGNPIFQDGELLVHTDAYQRLKNIFGTSAIKEWYRSEGSELASIPKAIVHGLDAAQSEMKKTMLGMLSTFHQVQEGTHAIGHRVSPLGFVKGGLTERLLGRNLPAAFTIPKIDLTRNASQMDAANHGLMLNPDRISEKTFMEGVGGTGIISKIPGVGKLADMYANYLFHQYIPGLKFKTYEKMVERNMGVYAKDLKSGKVTPEEIKFLSAEQSNAAYGHLNYADIGRNPTMQHLMQLTLLAPDFLEARSRFVGQAIKGTAGFKAGREQIIAVGLLAAVQFAVSKIISKLASGEWHFDRPFEAVVGDRSYSLRSVPEDLFKLHEDWAKFTKSRLNPMTAKTPIQLLEGRNYRGEKVTKMETMGELLATYIPITLRSIPKLKDLTTTGRNRTVTPWEEFVGTMGIRSERFSPINTVYDLASKWRKDQGEKEDRGTYPTSKYQQMRYALEDGDTKRAMSEYEKLKADAKGNSDKVFDGFKQSLNTPFTGSIENDMKFERSLNPEQQKVYEYAKDKRNRVWQGFVNMPRD